MKIVKLVILAGLMTSGMATVAMESKNSEESSDIFSPHNWPVQSQEAYEKYVVAALNADKETQPEVAILKPLLKTPEIKEGYLARAERKLHSLRGKFNSLKSKIGFPTNYMTANNFCAAMTAGFGIKNFE